MRAAVAFSVRASRRSASPPFKPDDAAGRDRARADVENIAVLDLIDAHLRDGVTGFWRDRPGD